MIFQATTLMSNLNSCGFLLRGKVQYLSTVVLPKPINQLATTVSGDWILLAETEPLLDSKEAVYSRELKDTEYQGIMSSKNFDVKLFSLFHPHSVFKLLHFGQAKDSRCFIWYKTTFGGGRTIRVRQNNKKRLQTNEYSNNQAK